MINFLRKFLFLAALLTVSGVSYWLFFIPSDYCVIPVEIDTRWNLPLVQMEIANKKYKVELALGISYSSLFSKELNEIDKKSFETFSHFDVRGNSYESTLYEVSDVKIHDFFLSKMKVEEESPESVTSCVLDGDIDGLPYTGRLGRDAFEGKNILLDFPQSKIILCKNFKDLAWSHYNLKDFIKTSFFFDRRVGICFQVETDSGVKNLLLSTGASINLLSPPSEEAMLSEEISRGFPIWRSKKLVLGDHDFGEAKFYLLQLPPCWDKIDGMLGMDFLKKHTIYLDIDQSIAYIAKSSIPKMIQESASGRD